MQRRPRSRSDRIFVTLPKLREKQKFLSNRYRKRKKRRRSRLRPIASSTSLLERMTMRRKTTMIRHKRTKPMQRQRMPKKYLSIVMKMTRQHLRQLRAIQRKSKRNPKLLPHKSRKSRKRPVMKTKNPRSPLQA